MALQESKIEVELRPHIGTRNTPLGPVEVEHDQWIVIVRRNGLDPRQVGYLNKRPGAKVMHLAGNLERFGAKLIEEIEKATAEVRAAMDKPAAAKTAEAK